MECCDIDNWLNEVCLRQLLYAPIYQVTKNVVFSEIINSITSLKTVKGRGSRKEIMGGRREGRFKRF